MLFPYRFCFLACLCPDTLRFRKHLPADQCFMSISHGDMMLRRCRPLLVIDCLTLALHKVAHVYL